ncbi:MAG: tetratricopeptide repeat protein [Syntrophaceae bacterium]|nr:tetratricopeptide repeat protein [Syntrophaceae bacterium]
MSDAIDRNAVVNINIKLNECKTHLQKQNIYSCITGFKEVLELMKATRMLASDAKELHKDVNKFQDSLAASKTFRDVYGPVTFRDDDFDTSLDFMHQLIMIKEEEVQEIMAQRQIDDAIQKLGALASRKEIIEEACLALERGDFASVQEIIGGDEEVRFYLVNLYNSDGINNRKNGDYDKAITQYLKAIAVQPADENLFYNLARAHLEKDELKEAEDAMKHGLEINPQFREGICLNQYIIERESS